MIETDISVDPAWGEEAALTALTTRAVSAALAASPYAEWVNAPALFSISVRLGDDAEVQVLNRDYRGKDKPTNVLSFPMVQADLLAGLANTDDGEVLLGDIILARETCLAEAAEKAISPLDHAAHLIIHGTLHLIGYDHQNDGEAATMEALEVKALALMGIANPY